MRFPNHPSTPLSYDQDESGFADAPPVNRFWNLIVDCPCDKKGKEKERPFVALDELTDKVWMMMMAWCARRLNGNLSNVSNVRSWRCFVAI
jgi:hypothetical protein